MKIIFACVHNAGRSQMAAALFNRLALEAAASANSAKSLSATAISAGTNPAGKVHDVVKESMAKIGIDLSQVKPQLLTQDLACDAQMLITMGCGEACPNVPGLKREDWPLPDPKDKSEEEVDSIRDQIHDRVLDLINRLQNVDLDKLTLKA